MGKRIKSLRKELGLTQQQLADKIGVHNNNLSKWELGQSRPDISSLVLIAKALGVTVDSLLGEVRQDGVEGERFDAVEMGKCLAILRKGAGLSQRQLANEIQASADSISKWERAEASPDIDRLLDLANFYKVAPSAIYFGKASFANPSNKSAIVSRKKRWVVITAILLIVTLLLGGFCLMVNYLEGLQTPDPPKNPTEKPGVPEQPQVPILSNYVSPTERKLLLGKQGNGVDVYSYQGDSVVVMFEGTLSVVDNKTLAVSNSEGFKAVYGNVKMDVHLADGMVVYKGEKLGTVELSNNPNQPNTHLHLEMYYQDTVLDVTDYCVFAEPMFSSPIAMPTGVEYYGSNLLYNPTLKQWYAHLDIALFASANTAVLAPFGGIVESISKKSDYFGDVITLSYRNGITATLTNVVVDSTISVGDVVNKGDVIGYVQDVTYAGENEITHLDFAIYKDGKRQNPFDYVIF